MKAIMVILLSAMLTDNFVLSKFMGICPFLGVSKKLDSATGMGIAVTFVMICATVVTYPIHHGILVPNGLEYFDTVVFILVIALFVQLVENFLKKCVPSHRGSAFFFYGHDDASWAIAPCLRQFTWNSMQIVCQIP